MDAPVQASEVSRLLGVLDQATERISRSYQQIASLQAELAEKERELARRSRLEMLGRMASTLAHEIRNPLGGIRLYADMMRRDAADGQARAICDRILAAVEDLDRLVEDMLLYGRDAAPARAPHRLEWVLDQALSLARLDGRIRVERRYALDRPVFCDAAMLGRACLNLILNAAQAMGEGTLVLGTSRDGEFAKISVRDSGPGIALDVLPRLFTPFVTTRAQGTGLGLAISSKIAEAHGGSITASNVEPRGAEFVIRLPL